MALYLLGSHYWGINTPSSDEDYTSFRLPTFEQLYNGEVVSTHEEKLQGFDCLYDLNTKDWRLFVKELKKGSITIMECMYSRPLKYINRETKILDFIEKNKDDLFMENRNRFLKVCMEEAKSRILAIEKDLDNIDKKQLAHLYKCVSMFNEVVYLNSNPFDEVMLKNRKIQMNTIRNTGFCAKPINTFLPTQELYDHLSNESKKMHDLSISKEGKFFEDSDYPVTNRLDRVIYNTVHDNVLYELTY